MIDQVETAILVVGAGPAGLTATSWTVRDSNP